MSLSLEQSESYINKIENGKALLSMQVFFYIYDYFGITPRDFFDEGNRDPAVIDDLVSDMKTLTDKQISSPKDR